jgi:hypothetical protein
MSLAKFLSYRGIHLSDAVASDPLLADAVRRCRLDGVDPATATAGDFVRTVDAFSAELAAMWGPDDAAAWPVIWPTLAKRWGLEGATSGDFVAHVRGLATKAQELGFPTVSALAAHGRELERKIAAIEAKSKAIEAKLHMSAVATAIRDVPMTPHQRMSVLNQCRDHGPEAALSMAEAVGASVREAMPVWYRQSLEGPKHEPPVTFEHPAKMAAAQGAASPAMTNAEKHAFIAQHGPKAYRDLKRSN